MSQAMHGSRLTLALLLVACGPRPAEPAMNGMSSMSGMSGSSGEGMTTGPAATSGTSEAPTSGGPATGDATGSSSTGSTSEGAASSTSAASSSSGAGSSTGEACDFYGSCEENEHCTPEARKNAEVAGSTPLGEFVGTFAFASAVLVISDLGTLTILPEYVQDLCVAGPQLRLELGTDKGEDYMVEAPIVVDDGQGQTAAATALVHVSNCCQILWFCDCKNPSPYEVEFSVEGDGWSLAGKVRPNCCRSHSIDEAA